jgi:hypothetical protein
LRPRRHAALFAVVIRGAAVALGASAIAAPMPALAQVDPYKQHMDNGVKLFADKNYPAAIVEFETAYAAKPKAGPLINIALCHKAQFRYPKAIEMLELALTKHLDTMAEEDRTAAIDAINEMKALLGHVRVTVKPPGAKLTIDGEVQSAEAMKKPIPVAPGVHAVSASLQGHQTATQDVRVASGENKEVLLTLVRAAAPAATTADAKGAPAAKPAATRHSTALVVAGVIVGGVGVLALGSGVAITASKRILCPEEPAKDEENPNPLCETDRRIGTGVGLIVFGTIGLAVGVPMFFVGNGPPRKPAQSPAATARPAVLVGPTSAALRWTF